MDRGFGRLRRVAVAGVAVALAGAGAAHAAPLTWTGQGSTPNWSNTSNWSPAASPSGTTSSLTFGALPAPCPYAGTPTCITGTNDVSGVSVNSISIDTAEPYEPHR